MMTTTHALISCGLLTRRNDTARNWAAALGGVLPDVPMMVLYASDKFVHGLSDDVIWGERYWSDSWQIPVAISHSIPIYAVVLALGVLCHSEVLKIYALSTFLHILGDLPVHRDDAHMHFWPLSNWKFISPVSYWDERYHGAIVSRVELVIAAAMIAVLWRRFDSTRVRAALICALAVFCGRAVLFQRHASSRLIVRDPVVSQ